MISINRAVFDYRSLEVWWKARRMVRRVYELTARYPAAERFGLISQTRRASVSVAANLAEGSGRKGSSDFARFVDIAIGSAYELECHLLLANDLGMVGDALLMKVLVDLEEIKRMLIGLARSLRVAKTSE